MKIYGVVMAGGGGTRFWPLSRKALPKQFLNLSGNEIMVNETIDRLKSVADEVFVVTNVTQAELMQNKTAGRIRKDHILEEPAARNTAACIGYAAMEILKKYGDGIMCVLPSDHFIQDLGEYRRLLLEAARAAEKSNKLVTIGIKPTFPSTGYGYICCGEESDDENFAGVKSYSVEKFVEKPDFETAERYLKEGHYLWNSGMFLWKASVIIQQFRELLPDIYRCLERIGDAMGTDRESEVIYDIYPKIPKISIDYGIMERAGNVVVFPGSFGWNDVGSFDALEDVKERDDSGNTLYGDVVAKDSNNNIIYAKTKLVAAVGVENLVIVETEDAVLVCKKEDAQRVKEIVGYLEETNNFKYL